VIRRVLPGRAAHRLLRWRNLLVSLAFYQLCRRKPERAKRYLRRGLLRELPSDIEIDTHFKPRYEPWDQRLCLAPDGDLFQAMRSGRASVVTDEVETFTPRGIRLKSGRELPADVIVAATGLNLQAFGGIHLEVDGVSVEPGQCLAYKGLMLRDVPNCAFCAGYTNASWTLRAELSADYIGRLLRLMDRRGYTRCVPRCDSDSLQAQPLLPLKSGYIQRGVDIIPKQGSHRPWAMPQNYLLDLLSLRLSGIEDGALELS
ncbi:MAG TPA: NAD(P)/FAD-dependent oxidoreductase, partial [Isosphaeraceae bacterium]|nr:NAD(P)/FAD-dependent oxidoreductase [Isosphaeraceae bacterium]